MTESTYDVDLSDEIVVADEYYLAYDVEGPDGPKFGPLLPAGTVLPWSGKLEDVPNGWVVCDGTTLLTDQNPSPNLCGKFILAVDGSNGPQSSNGFTAGAFSGTLNTTSNGAHSHSFPSGLNNVSTKHGSSNDSIVIHNPSGSVSSEKTASGGKHPHSLTLSATATASNTFDGKVVPKWAACYYIIKLA